MSPPYVRTMPFEDLFECTTSADLFLPLGRMHFELGFPSPAGDFEEDLINLNCLLIRNPIATFLYRAGGLSMIDAGIYVWRYPLH